MISQTAEHALRALLYLTRQDGRSVSANDIAYAIDAPANYLGKILQTLSRHGLVTGTRGPAGGFRLAADPSRISIADIVNVFKEPVRSKVCLLGGGPCSDENACTAHQRWSALQHDVAQQLENTSIADLTALDVVHPKFPVTTHRAARIAV
jgi:Rrf2 family transcriptional regulator, iron-sulfur cluster assembly transcription factor